MPEPANDQATAPPEVAAALPTPDNLILFLDSLRQQGYRIDAGQMGAAVRLLLDAHAAGPDSSEARRLKYRLVPVIATTAAEQEDLYNRLGDWRDRLYGATPPILRPALPDPGAEVTLLEDRAAVLDGIVRRRSLLFVRYLAKVLRGLSRRHVSPITSTTAPVVRHALTRRVGPGAATEVTRRDPRTRILLAAASAVVALGISSYMLSSPSPPTAPERDTNDYQSKFYNWAGPSAVGGLTEALIALPAISLAAWLALRWRRRTLWKSYGAIVLDTELATVPVPVNLSEVLCASPEFRRTSHELRRHRYRPTRQLDVRRTVNATASGAGLFSPVYRERPQLPDYLFLIEQKSTNDHIARLFDVAVEHLRSEDVFIQRYYFQSDPRQVQLDDTDRTTVPLSDLIAQTQDHRLIVIATAEGFFHPLTGELEAWVNRLEPWRSRTVLSTRPLEQWTEAELRLLGEGFSLATAEVSGFAAAGEKIAFGTDEPELLEGVVVPPPLR